MTCRYTWWVVMVWIWMVGGSPLWAVEVLAGPTVEATGNEATVRWTTDVVCGTRLRFGLSAQAMEIKAEVPGVRREHEVVIKGLAAGQTYHFRIGTARATLREGRFVAGQLLGEGMAGATSPGAQGVKPSDQGAPRPSTPKGSAADLLRAPPARVSWGNLDTLQDHFDRHGPDFKSTSPEDYAEQAWRFLQRAINEGLPAKVDEADGTIRVYDSKTGAFAAFQANGRTKTYFKPGNPGYWQRQPGRPTKLRRNE